MYCAVSQIGSPSTSQGQPTVDTSIIVQDLQVSSPLASASTEMRLPGAASPKSPSSPSSSNPNFGPPAPAMITWDAIQYVGFDRHVRSFSPIIASIHLLLCVLMAIQTTSITPSLHNSVGFSLFWKFCLCAHKCQCGVNGRQLLMVAFALRHGTTATQASMLIALVIECSQLMDIDEKTIDVSALSGDRARVCDCTVVTETHEENKNEILIVELPTANTCFCHCVQVSS